MSRQIPIAVIAVVSDALANRFTHAAIDQMMEAAGLELSSPGGNRQVKTRAWFNHANKTSRDPLQILGKVIAEFMEKVYDDEFDKTLFVDQERVRRTLGNYGLSYMRGGYITSGSGTKVGETLKDIIEARDLSGLQTEFDRIYENLEADPPAAVTASCALLESLFKTYIEDNKLEMPAEESIKPLWKVVRKDLKLDPAIVADDDLKTILTGLAAIVEGTGSLRTHKGSAHGRGKTAYKLKPRHARLAAHAAFTLASYVLEAWESASVGGTTTSS
jgi:abortive infection Abi-like protein